MVKNAKGIQGHALVKGHLGAAFCQNSVGSVVQCAFQTDCYKLGATDAE